jgi:hypothetical protein
MLHQVASKHSTTRATASLATTPWLGASDTLPTEFSRGCGRDRGGAPGRAESRTYSMRSVLGTVKGLVAVDAGKVGAATLVLMRVQLLLSENIAAILTGWLAGAKARGRAEYPLRTKSSACWATSTSESRRSEGRNGQASESIGVGRQHGERMERGR